MSELAKAREEFVKEIWERIRKIMAEIKRIQDAKEAAETQKNENSSPAVDKPNDASKDSSMPEKAKPELESQAQEAVKDGAEEIFHEASGVESGAKSAMSEVTDKSSILGDAMGAAGSAVESAAGKVTSAVKGVAEKGVETAARAGAAAVTGGASEAVPGVGQAVGKVASKAASAVSSIADGPKPRGQVSKDPSEAGASFGKAAMNKVASGLKQHDQQQQQQMSVQNDASQSNTFNAMKP